MHLQTIAIPRRHIPKEIVARFLPDNPVIVEAGAHTGRGVLALKKFWPASTVHAFEPVPELFARLQLTTKSLSAVLCYNYALSNNDGTTQMHLSGGRCTAVSSLLQPKGYLIERPDVTFEQQKTVTCITLNTWAPKYSINNIDALWLDVQGAELLVLQNAEAVLQKVRVIHTEISTIERYEGNPSLQEIVTLLKQYNFDLFATAFADKTWGNVLFVKSDLLQSCSRQN